MEISKLTPIPKPMLILEPNLIPEPIMIPELIPEPIPIPEPIRSQIRNRFRKLNPYLLSGIDSEENFIFPITAFLLFCFPHNSLESRIDSRESVSTVSDSFERILKLVLDLTFRSSITARSIVIARATN